MREAAVLVTQKRYQIELYLQWGTNRKSYTDGLSNGAIFNDLEQPNYIHSYRSSIDTIALNFLVFEKITLFCILTTDRQTNKQTNKQMNSWTVTSSGLIIQRTVFDNTAGRDVHAAAEQ